MNIFLYQTLEDRGDPEFVENNGPFLARHKTAWLGPGYYFWDSHIELGHWWGKNVYRKSGYIICRGKAAVDGTCWDLHGNGNHRFEFEMACKEIVKQRLSSNTKLLVPEVIAFLSKSGTWPFEAIRALAVDSISFNSDIFVASRVKFKANHKSFLDLRPPVQLCLLKKRALSLQDYIVVHPEHYMDTQYA